ncbi:MAG: alpha/beta hydrolase [Nannocystis sp.]|nr:alpha/beta hydrolase [Nannocystis sp.]
MEEVLKRAKAVTSPATAAAPAGGEAAAEPGGQASSHAIKVDRLVFPVTLSDGKTYEVVGYLYYKGSYKHRPLQVLVHGTTYTHKYWDLPAINGVDYSYARYMADQEYAVLALDSLGAGESSKPDGDFINLAETAASVRQVLAELRGPGGVVDSGFDKIALVGHSFGAVINSLVQSTYGGVEVLVNTGFAFTPHELPIPPDAIAALLGTPYIGLPPEFRAAFFYHAPTADAAVIAHDNAEVADTFTRGQLLDMIAVFSDPGAAGIGRVTGPVLIQLGENDGLHPASLLADDAALYAGSPQVATATVPGVGHLLNAHLGAVAGWAQIVDWLAVTLPAS